MIEGIAGFVTWLGASFVVLASGRRGLALGTAFAAAGLSVLVWQGAGMIQASLLAAGGAIAVAGRLLIGPPGWGLMPPGSTPRIILCAAVGIVGLWVALAVTGGDGAALRFSVLVVVGLAGGRVLSSDAPQVQLASVALLALAAASTGALVSSRPSIWPYVLAGAIAAGAGWLRVSTPSAG